MTHRITQQQLDEAIAAQLDPNSYGTSIAIEKANLAGLTFASHDLDGTTIALSHLAGQRFGGAHSLQGISWIGNAVADCDFHSLSMNKAELLDCIFERCTFDTVSMFRADLTGTRFERCTFRDIDLSRCCLIRVLFFDCTFVDVRLPKEEMLAGLLDAEFDGTGTLVIKSTRLRAMPGALCPRTGYWFSPASEGSRRWVKADERMPDLNGGDFGTAVWQWDDIQGP